MGCECRFFFRVLPANDLQPADHRKCDDAENGGETRGLGSGVCWHNPPHPPLKGHPLPLKRQGGGGPSLMKPRGYPHPIPFLGDDLSSVSDVNPCRKTGGGSPFGYLGGGCLPKTSDAKGGYPTPPGAPDRHPPPIGKTGGWGSLAHETQGVPPPDPVFGRQQEFRLRRKPMPENGRGVPPWVPLGGYPFAPVGERGVGGVPSLKKKQAPPPQKIGGGWDLAAKMEQMKNVLSDVKSPPGKWGIPPPKGTWEGGPPSCQLARGGRGVPRIKKNTATPLPG
jgi:hypothetical protein